MQFRDDSWAKPVACIFKGPLYTLPPSKRRNYELGLHELV